MKALSPDIDGGIAVGLNEDLEQLEKENDPEFITKLLAKIIKETAQFTGGHNRRSQKANKLNKRKYRSIKRR